MPLAAIGAVLLLLKIFEIGPVANWSWLVVAAPFGLAALWWAIADSTGYTQRRAVEKMEQRKIARRERDMVALGLDPRRDRRKRAVRETAKSSAAAQRAPDKAAKGPDTEA